MKSILFCNGEILTGNLRDEAVEACLTRGKTILFAGDLREAVALADEETEVYDLSGRALIPAFLSTRPLSLATPEVPLSESEAAAGELLARGVACTRLDEASLSVLRMALEAGELTPDAYPALSLLFDRAERLEGRKPLLDLTDLLPAQLPPETPPPGAVLFAAPENREGCLSLLAFYRRSPRERRLLRLVVPKDCPPLPPCTPLFSLEQLPLALHRLSRGLSAVLLPEAGDIADAPAEMLPAVLRMLAYAPAEAEGIAAERGSIEWGKAADLLIYPFPLLGKTPDVLLRTPPEALFLDGVAWQSAVAWKSREDSSSFFEKYLDI